MSSLIYTILFFQTEWLKTQPALDECKQEIFQAMEDTFRMRRHFIVKIIPSMERILEEFPKLKDFNGAIVSKNEMSIILVDVILREIKWIFF